MTKKVFNMAGGLHSAAAYSALENRAYGSCAASPDSFACSAGAGMTIKIADGDGLISTTGNFARRIQSDAEETINVSAASPSYSRIDAVVAYIDNAIAPTTSVIDNTNGILNFACVAGTAASSPVAPTAAAIQAAIGAGNDYMVLYEVTVPSCATSMNNAVFKRKVKTLTALDLAMIPDKLITGSKIADDTITSDTVDFTTFSFEEQVVGVWVDGRKIYRKTISCGELPNATLKDIPVQINGIDIGWVDMSGSYAIGPNQIMPLPFSASNPYPTEVSYLAQEKAIRIVTSVDRTNYPISFVTLRYVKTA